MLKSLTPNLMVDDVRQTVDWCRSVPGFAVDAEVPADGEVGFAIVKRDDVGPIFQSTTNPSGDLPLSGMTPHLRSRPPGSHRR